MDDAEVPVDNLRLEFLPTEILLLIISHACDTQAIFRSLLLVNKQFHTLVKFDRLPHIPVRLEKDAIHSFWQFIQKTAGLAGYVRHLWIKGTSELCKVIANRCTNLISLACSKFVLYSICSSTSIKHTSLLELTLFDNWECWSYLTEFNDGRGVELCQRITHLRLWAADFDPQLFPSLTHFSYPGNKISSFSIIPQLAPLHVIPKLEQIVITTFFWANEPADERTKLLVGMDKRIRIVYFGLTEPGEFALWCGRVIQTDTLWTNQGTLKRLL